MSHSRPHVRRIRFESLETRQVLSAGGLVALAEPVALDLQPAVPVVSDAASAVRSNAEASSLNAAEVAGGTLTLDAVIPGTQNDLQISLGELALGNTELSGTIEIGTATGNGTDITGFTIDGGLIDASDVTGPLNLTGASAIPLDVDPSINLVTAGNFDASEVGVSINDGIAEVPLLGLVFDFSTDPIEGPGNGTGTIVVNSVSGSDYDLTVSIPVAIELEAAPGAIASISGTIVASGVITVAPDPAEIMSGFYSEIKGLIGSDDVLGGLIVDAKSAIDSGDTSLRGQVYVDIQTATAALSADAVSAFDTISAGIVDTEELNYLYYTVTVVIAELESLRDFLSGALASPASYQSLTLNEFFADAERAVQEEVFGVGVIV